MLKNAKSRKQIVKENNDNKLIGDIINNNKLIASLFLYL